MYSLWQASLKTRYPACLAVVFFFAGYLAIGICIYRDYGVSWDEPFNRRNGAISAIYINAKMNHFFISKEAIVQLNKMVRSKMAYVENSQAERSNFRYYDGQTLSGYRDKDYGVFFELFLIGSEWVLKLVETQDVYFMRHLFTFLLFYVSVIFFFMILQMRFKDWKMSLLGSFFLVISPRIFAHSFYNSKDVAFMSFYVMSCYSLLLFLEEKSLKTGLFHGLTSAILIDTRVAGIIMPCVTLAFYALDILTDRKRKGRLKSNLLVLSVYFLVLTGFVVLFWPTLWENPLHNFIQAVSNMSRFLRWDGPVFFLGTYIRASELPWYYVLLFMIITTPVLYLIALGVGIVAISKNIISALLTTLKRISKDQALKYDCVLLSLAVLPIVAVVVFGVPVYDGWRHLFFAYPPLLFVSIRGVVAAFAGQSIVSKKLTSYCFLRVTAIVLLIIGIGGPLWFMFQYHPFQNVYFNALAGDKIEEMYERDYWGLSYRQALEYVLEKDRSDPVRVSVANPPGRFNSLILGERARRLKFVPVEESDYFLTNYRGDNVRPVPLGWKEVFSINVEDFKIMGVYSR